MPRSGLPALSVSASLRLPLIERWLERIQPATVLEAGAGIGAMACRLAQRYDYLGYEPDETSYALAKTRLKHLGAGRMEHGVVPDQPERGFELVAAFEVLEHISDDSAALRTWGRWLTPGGHIVISVPAHSSRYGPCDEVVGHCRRYDLEGLRSVMLGSGFRVIAIESWGMPLGFVMEGIRNLVARRRLDNSRVGTPGSGRTFQPHASWGRSVELLVRPFAWMQYPFVKTDLGIGYVAVGKLEEGA